jgi:predicted enzyme related to lactoylglutathione lyase
MSNALDWFEIPVVELDRAMRFYEILLQTTLREEAFNGQRMAILPYRDGGVGGALIVGEQLVPSTQGTVVYLGAGEDLDGALARVAAAGGRALSGKIHLSDAVGSIAFFMDTEGNRIGLHSPR